ncbi:MAG: 50S ribosomal protein L18e [Candidatus Odinarchaeum yellowstonii]|uniref:Large ribosomal subunit protein eL18 n=1 Tax=Odinarchaeota yellowstonii (strain LCB_4) TaxID=1841599 RepID=A0AAF0IB83_ODILC|nr:MAG: 50S ribosomal protein L18e [Candidatus Odinarchaeum yellowstonii]
MVKPTGPTDKNIQDLIIKLKKKKAKVWLAVAEQLSKPRRLRPEVNLDKINRVAHDNDIIAVAGKILGRGELTKKVTLTAVNISQSALTKLSKSGSTYISLPDYIERNPDGKGVLLIK